MNTNSEKNKNGINIINISANQYKTNLITLYIKRPLKKEEATKNALIPYLLKSGSKKYDTESKIEKHLEELYGSTLSVNVSKVAEKQILTFKISFTNDRYLDENIQERVIDTLFEIVFNPYIVDNSFDDKKLDIEKLALKEALLSRINNKSLYAMDRILAYMCENEPFSIPEDGFVEDIEEINGKNLYAHYKKILAESEIDIAITGEIDSVLVEKKIKELYIAEKEVTPLGDIDNKKNIQEVKEIKENIDINQGQLLFGYRTNIDIKDNLMIPLVVYSTILGGSASSKLFLNVREKHSLAYSIGTSLERIKGILFIRAGIAINDYDKAKKLILEQVDDMNCGKISEDEILKAKKTLINSIKSIKDSVNNVADYMYILNLQGNIYTPETMMKRIESVTKEEIQSISKYLQLDTIYFLTNEEGINE